MAYYFYPADIEQKAVHFEVNGKRPEAEEVKELTEIVFEKKPVSRSEKKAAWRNFVQFIGMAVSCLVIGYLISIIPGRRGSGAGIVHLMGYTILFIGTPICTVIAFTQLFRPFRSSRKKEAAASFRWMWENGILNNENMFGDSRFGDVHYALDVLERGIPGTIERNGTESYISSLREMLNSAAEETTAAVREEQKWMAGTPLIKIEIGKETEVYPNVSEMDATITYSDVLQGRNDKSKTTFYITAILKLHITQVFIKAGDYWYPYDLTPAIQRCKKEKTVSGAAEMESQHEQQTE